MLHHAVLIGGPNGAGKSTFARNLVIRSARDYALLNADDIAKELAEQKAHDTGLGILAGREMLRRLAQLVDERSDLMVESTLSGRSYARPLLDWSRKGYSTSLHYLRLPDLKTSIDRVRRRVAHGGHDIPEADLRRRFARSQSNFEAIYKPVVDEWFLYDSVEGNFILVARGTRE